MIELLAAFNALLPKDLGSRRAGGGLAYGANPRQMLDIYAPRAAGNGRPVIIFFYGGAWSSGNRQGYGFVGRALAAKGFVVAVPDYRLVPEVEYPGFLEDAAAAVRWVRAHAGEYGGDGGRIVTMGHSAGAYIAAMLALDPGLLGNDRMAIRGLAGLAGPYDFLPLDDSATIAAFGNWPDLAETQPVNHAAAGSPPALLLHGDADTRVKPRHTRALAERLRGAGSDARTHLYPGIGHASILTSLAVPLRWRAPVLADVVRFAGEVTDPSR